MLNHIFGSKDILQFEVGAKDPESASMRRVDIHALNLHLTENDNDVYVPNFLFRLDKALASFRKKTRFEQRPDVFGELGPKDIHLIFTDGSEKYPDTLKFSSLYAFLQFGDVTLNVASYLIPTQGGLYLTCEIRGPQEDTTGRDIRVSEVHAETLSQTMADTLELVAGEYGGEKSFLS